MSIVLINDINHQLVAVDTEQYADYQYTADDNFSWRDEPVAKLVARYTFVKHPDHPSFAGSTGSAGVIDNLAVSRDGVIYGNAYSEAFTENGVNYPAGEYLVRLVSAADTVYNDGNGVYTVPYHVVPVSNDDGLYIRGDISKQNPVSFIDIGEKEYLVASNSQADSYASKQESTNLLIDPETGKSTGIMLDNNGDGQGDKAYDSSPQPSASGTTVPITGPREYNDLELIQDAQTGQYYALIMSVYGGEKYNGRYASFIDRYKVHVTPNTDDAAGPPIMTIDTSSKALIAILKSEYRGFSINEDGSADFLPGATNHDYGMIKVQRVDEVDTSYNTFVDFAVAKKADEPRVIDPSYDYDLAYRIRLADYAAPADADAANGQYLYGNEGGLPGIPLADYPGEKSGSAGAPCFTVGTLIRTADGDKRVEDLKIGDMIITLGGGLIPVRWIGRRQIRTAELVQNPNLRPIRIRAGALGHGLPLRDLLVSPQHRMLISSKIAIRMFSAGEILVAAKHLLGCEGVEIAEEVTSVTYIHFMCDSHAVVLAEGAPSETLLLGPIARQLIGSAALEEIYILFPGLREDKTPQPARKIVSGRAGRQLVRRHAKNSIALYQPITVAKVPQS